MKYWERRFQKLRSGKMPRPRWFTFMQENGGTYVACRNTSCLYNGCHNDLNTLDCGLETCNIPFEIIRTSVGWPPTREDFEIMIGRFVEGKIKIPCSMYNRKYNTEW
jgi:hypothetical protein